MELSSNENITGIATRAKRNVVEIRTRLIDQDSTRICIFIQSPEFQTRLIFIQTKILNWNDTILQFKLIPVLK